jgi:hypothetical protein
VYNPKVFGRKKDDENPHPAYSQNPSPYDFWFFDYAKEQLKD